MIVEREVHEVETEAGKFYIQILAAELSTVSKWSEGERAHVPAEKVKPRVWLSTSPNFEHDVEQGHLKIRGKAYTINHQLSLLVNGWSNESWWNGAYHNAKDKQLDRSAKTWDLLYDLEREALARWVEEHPNWETESLRYRLEANRDSELDEVRRLAEEASQAGGRAAKWQTRIEALIA
ncbi:hypothetical protein ACIPX0_26505 [Streptomyces sp. NPDC090075]|uniref:hypothetical protein n=1 Tax=Streptomyces sp. NPDC090075 TaxID=3365937 RepID=UPI0038141EB9